MRVTDEIADIVFRNDENGYSVVRLATSGLTAVGIFPFISVGQEFEFEGEIINNARYGKQLQVTSFEVIPPNTPKKIKQFLASGLIEGVGPVTASNIVKTFGKDTLLIIEHNPTELIAVKGISIKKAKIIGEKYGAIKQMQASVLFLQKFDISMNMAIRIYNHYKDDTIEVVQTNPYALIETIDGIGFLTADKMAKEIGISYAGTFRVRAGIVYTLKQSSEQDGNTYLPLDKLRLGVCRLLKIKMETLTEVFDGVIKELCLDRYLTVVDDGVMLTRFYIAEKGIASRLMTLAYQSDNSESITNTSLENIIKNYQIVNKIVLHENQVDAIRTAVTRGVCVITGGPGTGKTTIIKAILSINDAEGKVTQLLAPTGRAAKRLEEATGRTASTIHRALDIDYKGGRGSFMSDEEAMLRADVIIIDEFSMCDATLTSQMLKRIMPSSRLIFVGDIDQLPSVGAGNVLCDVIASATLPVMRLTEIYRQTEHSQIVYAAHAVNRGEMPCLDNKNDDFFFENSLSLQDIKEKVLKLVTHRIPNFLGVESSKIQVLCPMKAGLAGVNSLNAELQESLNPPDLSKTEYDYNGLVFRVGDRVMQTVNNYQQEYTKNGQSGSGVFNGDIGTVISITRSNGEIMVELEDGRLTTYTRADLGSLVLAYAITVHKSQGCEFDVVVIPVVSGAYMILTRNLLYTAITRAKRMCVLVGSAENIEKMVRNTYTKERYSMLSKFLVEMRDKTKMLFE